MRFLPPKPPPKPSAAAPPAAPAPIADDAGIDSPPASETETASTPAPAPAPVVTSRPSLRDVYNPGSSRASLVSSSSNRNVGKLNKTASWINRNPDAVPNQEDTSVSSMEEEKGSEPRPTASEEPAPAKTEPPEAPAETEETTETEIKPAAKGLPWMQKEANKPKEPPAWMKKLKKTASARTVEVNTEEESATKPEEEPATEAEVEPEVEAAETEETAAPDPKDAATSESSEPEKRAMEELPKRRSVKDLGGWLTKTIDDKQSQKAQAPIAAKTAPKSTPVTVDSATEGKPTEPHVHFADKDTGSLAETTAASSTPAADASLEGSSRAGSVPDAPSVSNTIMTDESEYEEVIEEDESEMVEVTEHDDDEEEEEEEEEVLEITEHDEEEIIEEVTEREDDEIIEEVTEREDDELIEEITEREDDETIEEYEDDDDKEEEEVIEVDKDEEVIEEEVVHEDVVEESVDDFTEAEVAQDDSEEGDEQNKKDVGGAVVAIAASPTPAPASATVTAASLGDREPARAPPTLSSAQSKPTRSSTVSKEDYKDPNDVDALQGWVTGFEEGEASKVTSKQPDRPYPFEVHDSEKLVRPVAEGEANTSIEREPTGEPSAGTAASSHSEEGEEKSNSSTQSELVSVVVIADQAVPKNEGDGDIAFAHSDSQDSQEDEANKASTQKAETAATIVASSAAATADAAIFDQEGIQEDGTNETVTELEEDRNIMVKHQTQDEDEEEKVEEETLVEEEVLAASESKAIVPVVYSDGSAGDIETGQDTQDKNAVAGGAAGATGVIVAADAATGADPNNGAVQTEREKDDDTQFYSVIVILLLLAVCALFAILIWGTGTIDITGGDDFVGKKPTTPFDPYAPGDCNFSDQTQPHVISQCVCNDRVTTLTNDARDKYDALVSGFLVPDIYSEWTLPLESCEPENQALVWLSTSMADTTTDLTQRYLMAFLYFSTNGPQWEKQSLWLEEDGLCSWYGLSCGDENVMRDIGLESNSLLGEVRSFASIKHELQHSLATNSPV